MKRENKAIAFSALLHAVVIGLALAHLPKRKDPPPPPKPVQVVELQPQKPTPRQKIKEAIPNGPLPCKNFYGGIGIYVHLVPLMPDRMLIDTVMTGYAAEKAGLHEGDEIDLNHSDEVTGEPGQVIVIYIFRQDIPLRFEMIRSKVCVGE